MRFEIARLSDGWADILFHLDDPGWLCAVELKDGTMSMFGVENKTWRFADVSDLEPYASPRFFLEFLKLLNEISSIESGSRYVLFSDEHCEGAFSVHKRAPDSYEITLCEYSSRFSHAREPGVIIDSRITGDDAEVFVISEDMRLEYMEHVESCIYTDFKGNRASRYIREESLTFGEILPDKAVIVDERGLVLGRRTGIHRMVRGALEGIRERWDLYPVQNTLTEAEFLRFMLSVETALGQYATDNGLKYFCKNWEPIFPREEFTKLEKFLRSKGVPEPHSALH